MEFQVRDAIKLGEATPTCCRPSILFEAEEMGMASAVAERPSESDSSSTSIWSSSRSFCVNVMYALTGVYIGLLSYRRANGGS